MGSADFSPCAILLATGNTEKNLQSTASFFRESWDVASTLNKWWSLQVLHVFPDTALNLEQAQMLSPLFIALERVTSKLTGQQVVTHTLLGLWKVKVCQRWFATAIGATCHFCRAFARVQGSLCALPGTSCQSLTFA